MHIKIDVMKVTQPIGDFYVAVMKSEDLYSLSSSDIIKITEKNEKEPYQGVQRELRPSKIKDIVEYLTNDKEATFPNSIIVNLNKECRKKITDDQIIIQNRKDAFSILDGQHRLEGLHEAKMNVDVVVSIFDALNEDLQNNVFDTINSEQTKVNRSMILYKQSYSKWNTPGKFASKLSVSFALDNKSVWNNKIKLIGIKDEISQEGQISLHAFYEPIIDMIYNNDKDYFEIKNELKINGNIVSKINKSIDEEKYILWPYYKEQNEGLIYKILNNYFNALKDTLPEDFEDPTSMIQKTTGYNAFMKLFKDLYQDGFKKGTLTYNFFKEKVKKLEYFNGKINSKNYASSGLQSANVLYLELKKAIYS